MIVKEDDERYQYHLNMGFEGTLLKLTLEV